MVQQGLALVSLAKTYLRSAIHDEATAALAQANEVVRQDALRVQGMVLAGEQRWDEADAAFTAATRLAKAMP